MFNNSLLIGKSDMTDKEQRNKSKENHIDYKANNFGLLGNVIASKDFMCFFNRKKICSVFENSIFTD